jgi:hypothetical protein
MGLTIHFEGRLKSESSFSKLMRIALAFAKKHRFKYFVLDERDRGLLRLVNRKLVQYYGPTKGIIIVPENCEPVIIEFDRDLCVQHFCKTQHTDATMHIKLIDLITEIEPFFQILHVFDQGEYWEKRDVNILQEKFIRAAELFQLKKPRPGFKGQSYL